MVRYDRIVREWWLSSNFWICHGWWDMIIPLQF